MRRCTAEAVAAAAAVFFVMTALPVVAGAQVSTQQSRATPIGNPAPVYSHRKRQHQGPPTATPSPLPAPSATPAPTPPPTPAPSNTGASTNPAGSNGAAAGSGATPTSPGGGVANHIPPRTATPNPLFDLAAAQAPPIEALTPVRDVSFGDALQVGPLLLVADVVGLGVLCYLVRKRWLAPPV